MPFNDFKSVFTCAKINIDRHFPQVLKRLGWANIHQNVSHAEVESEWPNYVFVLDYETRVVEKPLARYDFKVEIRRCLHGRRSEPADACTRYGCVTFQSRTHFQYFMSPFGIVPWVLNVAQCVRALVVQRAYGDLVAVLVQIAHEAIGRAVEWVGQEESELRLKPVWITQIFDQIFV